MSYHLKFRFVLAVLMGMGFAAMTPWMSHSPTLKHSHVQVRVPANLVESKITGFDGSMDGDMIGTDRVVAHN